MAIFDIRRYFAGQAEGKAIINHPFFRDPSPISTYVPGAGKNERERPLISQREANHHTQAYGGTEAVDWVMDAVDLYADTAKDAGWHLERDGKRLIEKVTPHTPRDAEVGPADLYDLLKRPNPFMAYSEQTALTVMDLLLVGNAYWYKYRLREGGKPLALYRLQPAYVQVQPGPYGVEKYVYQPPGAPDPLEIDPGEIIHFKRPNPHNQFFGMGIIKGGGRAFDLEIALTDSQAYYFDNKADPSMIVQSDRRVPRDVFNKLRAQLRARAAGRDKTGELLVLEAGLTATSLTPNAREAMYRELQDASRDRICAMFRLSPKLLGISEAGSSGDKVQDARREFDNNTMRPFLRGLAMQVTLDLAVAWNVDFVIDYRYVMPQEELLKQAGDFAALPGVKVREIRRFVQPLGVLDGESTGDDEIDEMVLNLPGEDLGPDGQPLNGEDGFADRNLTAEAGRPPDGENTRAFPRGGGALPAGSRARRVSTKALSLDDVMLELDRLQLETKAANDDNVRITVGNKLPDEQRPQDTLADTRDGDLDAVVSDMATDVFRAVQTLERGLLDHVEGKAFRPNDLVKRLRNSESWGSFRTLLEVALTKGTQRAASAAAIHQAQQGIIDDDLDYEGIAKSVIFRPEGVPSITQNLKDEIVQKVAKVVRDGGDRAMVDQVIRESVDFWRQHKSETVALTEAVEAYNETTLTLFERQGDATVFVVDGDDHDEPCREANGSVWDITEARARRSEHPRCRRAFLRVAPVE